MSLEKNIKLDEYQRVCRLAKLVEVANSKTYIFKIKDGVEGVEFISGSIIPFWIKTNPDNTKEKLLDQPVSSKDIIAVLGAFEEKPKEEKKDEQSKSESKEIQKKDVIGMMPECLTKELIQKWALLPVQERLIMLQNTDPSQIEERKGRAGQNYKYVPISYMIKAANMAFGFAWSVKVISWIETTTEIICNLEVTVDIQGKTITKAATGQKDITFKSGTKETLCKGDDYKACEADGIKKALSLFGIAQDVYYGEV